MQGWLTLLFTVGLLPLQPEAVVPTAWLLSMASGSAAPAAGVAASPGGAGACDGRQRGSCSSSAPEARIGSSYVPAFLAEQ